MQMLRAYSKLEIKSVDESKRILTGIATTPSPDSYDDIVEPTGAEFDLPIPFLWQHDATQPIGHVVDAKVTKNAITVSVQLAKVEEPGALQERLDEAWQSIKAGLVRGMSIGFRPIESAKIEGSWGQRFIKWAWLELSAVTIPANSDCSIQAIKSIDIAQRAATGQSQSGVDPPPGVSGKSKAKPAKRGFFITPTKDKTMTIAEQIASFEAKRAASAERMNAIMQKAADEGRTLDSEETEEYDGHNAEIKAVDEHLIRLKALEKANIAKATPVNPGANSNAASEVRGGVVTVKSNVPKGTAFARYVQTLALAKGNLMQAAEIAKRYDDSTPEVGVVIRAAVAAGTTTDSAWAAPLVPYQIMQNEFIELLRPATVIGKIDGFRRVPFNVKMPTQTGASTIGWVGQGAPKPVGKLAFGNKTLDYTKTAGIVVISEELARLSTPSAEAIIRQDMIDQTAQFLDVSFLDPSKAGSAGVSPAAITNGATNFSASGTDADAVRADLRKLFGAFTAANLSSAGAYWIMTETQATALAMMVNALGQPEFPGISANGGTLFGLPVVTSESVPTTTAGSPAVTSSLIILVKPSEILLADDGGVTIDVSREASLQMNDSPDNPATSSTVMVSLWQNNLIGIRAERWINWSPRRAAAVAYISGAHYGI